VAYGQTVVGTYEKKAKSTKKVTVVEGWHNIGVRGDEFEVIFSRIHGGLISYKYGGMQMLKSIPKPNFWRAMTENDIANLLPFRAGQWKLASMWPTIKYNDGLRMTNYEITKQEDHVEVEYTYHLPTTPAKDCKLKYDVYGDGEVQVTMTLPPSAEVGELPEYSVVFAMDSDFDHLKWYGRGEAETYPDRNHAKLGVYRNKVSDNMARYLVPQECGNKQDVRYASVTNDRGRGLLFRCNQLGFSALPYSVHELDNATHSVELPQPHFTYIRVGKQMGIAGDDTWGAKTHPEYMLDNSKEMKISFSFQGL
jgi:beta-galactosidase